MLEDGEWRLKHKAVDRREVSRLKGVVAFVAVCQSLPRVLNQNLLEGL